MVGSANACRDMVTGFTELDPELRARKLKTATADAMFEMLRPEGRNSGFGRPSQGSLTGSGKSRACYCSSTETLVVELTGFFDPLAKYETMPVSVAVPGLLGSAR
jgi:hypothetical protein